MVQTSPGQLVVCKEGRCLSLLGVPKEQWHDTPGSTPLTAAPQDLPSVPSLMSCHFPLDNPGPVALLNVLSSSLPHYLQISHFLFLKMPFLLLTSHPSQLSEKLKANIPGICFSE